MFEDNGFGPVLTVAPLELNFITAIIRHESATTYTPTSPGTFSFPLLTPVSQ